MVLGSNSLDVLGWGQILGSHGPDDDACHVLALLHIHIQVGFRKGGIQFLGRRTQLEVLLAVLLMVVLLALLACLLILGLGTSFGKGETQQLSTLIPTYSSALIPLPLLPSPPFLLLLKCSSPLHPLITTTFPPLLFDASYWFPSSPHCPLTFSLSSL